MDDETMESWRVRGKSEEYSEGGLGKEIGEVGISLSAEGLA